MRRGKVREGEGHLEEGAEAVAGVLVHGCSAHPALHQLYDTMANVRPRHLDQLLHHMAPTWVHHELENAGLRPLGPLPPGLGRLGLHHPLQLPVEGFHLHPHPRGPVISKHVTYLRLLKPRKSLHIPGWNAERKNQSNEGSQEEL